RIPPPPSPLPYTTLFRSPATPSPSKPSPQPQASTPTSSRSERAGSRAPAGDGAALARSSASARRRAAFFGAGDGHHGGAFVKAFAIGIRLRHPGCSLPLRPTLREPVMSSRLRNLFRQYAIRHARLELGALPLLDGAGKASGHVDRVQLAGGMVDVHGWSNCRAISLICDGFRSETYPNIPREDVVANHADMAPGKLVGFSVSVPSGRGAWMLICHDGPERVVHILPKPGRIALRMAQLRLAPGFVLRLAASLPDYLKWSLLGDVAARASYRKRLGLDLLPLDVALDPRIFATPDPEDEQAYPSAEITIVLPVYNALELLTEALARTVAHTDVPWRMIAVEDCSTDPAVRPFLRDWLARQDGTVADRVEILENERNLGFVESVNRALDRAVPLGNHVVLLNSDALVPPGWASRLLRPVLTHDAVATVTPMSNDAEILSVPTICQRTVLAPGEAEAINRTAATFHPD